MGSGEDAVGRVRLHDGVGETETVIVMIMWGNEVRGEIKDMMRVCRLAIVSDKVWWI